MRRLFCLGALALCAGVAAAAGHGAPRIISLAPNITELVYAAGAGQQLVGVVDYSDYPAAARSLPVIGDSFRLDYEAVRLLEPDLIIGWQSGNPREMIARLRSLNFRVVEIEAATLADIADHIELIGELAGTREQGLAAADAFRTGVSELRMKYAGTEQLRVFYQVSADPYFSVTGAHVISEIVELCGGRNVFAELPGLAPPVTLESVLAADPEVIIAGDTGSDAWKQGWQRWGSIAAVRRGALFSVNPDLVSRSGPRIVEGARSICEVLQAARQAR